MGNLNSDYGNQMKHHPYGYALFHPVSNGILKPGSVGYLDELGFWHPIANLEDPESLSQHGLTSPSAPLSRAKPSQIKRWTPKLSSQVKEVSCGFSGGISGALSGLPVDAKLHVEYRTSSDFGAVLLSSSPIVRNAFYYKAPFRAWMRENAINLLQGPLAEDIKEHGLCIVTQTHATRKCALTAWRSSENSVYFGFGAGTMGLAEIDPKVAWYAGRSESGWDIYEAEGDELEVVFANGLWFRRIIGSKVGSATPFGSVNAEKPTSKTRMRETDSPRRRGMTMDDDIILSDPDLGTIELRCETWGGPVECKAEDDEDDEDDAS